MTVFQILGAVGTVFGILSALGLAYVFLRGSVDRGTIASLKGSVEAMQIENELKDKKIAILEAREEHLTNEVKTLRNVVTNAEEVKAIYLLLNQHHAETNTILNNIENRLSAQITPGFKDNK